MNAGQALVRAYLHLNGFLTHTELPVIQKDKGEPYRVVTDIDILALRFPHSVNRVAKGRPGLPDDLIFEIDPELGISKDRMDLIIGEVKEGRPRVNPALRSPETLTTALARLGCCPPETLPDVIEKLHQRGEAFAVTGEGSSGVPCRIRIVAFGDGEPGEREGYSVFQLKRVEEFVREYLRRYRSVLHPVDLADPALGVLHLLEKLST